MMIAGSVIVAGGKWFVAGGRVNTETVIDLVLSSLIN